MWQCIQQWYHDVWIWQMYWRQNWKALWCQKRLYSVWPVQFLIQMKYFHVIILQMSHAYHQPCYSSSCFNKKQSEVLQPSQCQWTHPWPLCGGTRWAETYLCNFCEGKHGVVSFHRLMITCYDVVKEHSLAQWKELLRYLQTQSSVKQPVQLLVDMKVQWGSTYVMLNCSNLNQKVNHISHEFRLCLHGTSHNTLMTFSDQIWPSSKLLSHHSLHPHELHHTHTNHTTLTWPSAHTHTWKFSSPDSVPL